MQIKLITDYSIRFVLFLASQGLGARKTRNEVARRMGISPGYVRRVAQGLEDAGIVSAEQGYRGGFFLLHPPEEITLYDVLAASEDTMLLNRCLKDSALCDRGAAPYCKVHQCLAGLQRGMEARLREIRIADLI